MRIVRNIEELKLEPKGSLALTPTMGYFHEGHLDLMRKAREANDTLVVSLFVNPTQFGEGEDYERYPRNLERDAAMAESVGVDVLFVPTVDEMFPRRTTQVVVNGVTDRFEGALRPGHFTGVATVVYKLFNIVRPHRAYFGWKDIQQCMVIQRMVEDLNCPVQVEFVETYREPDGLAMSSRNSYLSESERAIAPELHRQLVIASNEVIRNGRSNIGSFHGQLGVYRQALEAKGFSVDYFDLVSLPEFAVATDKDDVIVFIVAAKLGRTRLIDNVRVYWRNNER